MLIFELALFRPPTPDPEEESDDVDDSMETMDPLTSEELEDLDRSRFVSDPSTVSQGPAATIAVDPDTFEPGVADTDSQVACSSNLLKSLWTGNNLHYGLGEAFKLSKAK